MAAPGPSGATPAPIQVPTDGEELMAIINETMKRTTVALSSTLATATEKQVLKVRFTIFVAAVNKLSILTQRADAPVFPTAVALGEAMAAIQYLNSHLDALHLENFPLNPTHSSQ